MVRLQLVPQIIILLILLSFQSHNGSIATLYSKEYRNKYAEGFNPIMVRLQHADALLCSVMDISFNPIMVRLQRAIVRLSRGALGGFNPIMVRLQPSSGNPGRAALIISFNPIMVRLQRASPSWLTTRRKLVSIP